MFTKTESPDNNVVYTCPIPSYMFTQPIHQQVLDLNRCPTIMAEPHTLLILISCQPNRYTLDNRQRACHKATPLERLFLALTYPSLFP